MRAEEKGKITLHGRTEVLQCLRRTLMFLFLRPRSTLPPNHPSSVRCVHVERVYAAELTMISHLSVHANVCRLYCYRIRTVQRCHHLFEASIFQVVVKYSYFHLPTDGEQLKFSNKP